MASERPERRMESGAPAGHAALVCVQLCFGLMPIFGKWAFEPGGFAPLGVAAWRIAIGSLVLFSLSIWLHPREWRLRGSDCWQIWLLSWAGVGLNQGLYLAGLARTSAIQAGLMTCLIPVFTFLIAALARHERLAWTRILGVGLALSGAAPLFLAGGAEFKLAPGAALLAGSSLVYSSYLVFSKPLLTRHPPLVMLSWVYLGSLPLAVLYGWRAPLLPSASASPSPWIALGLILLFPTVLAYLLNLFALARVPASTTAIYIYAQPLITALASALVLGERPTAVMLRSAALLFLGIWLVARPAREKLSALPTVT